MNAAASVPSSAKAGWCLRFLSGAVKGRTIALRPGANVLGSGGDSDVLLPGGDVLAKHLVVNVGELVVTLQRVGDAPAALNGEALAATRRSVVAGDVVSVGAIDFQLDRSYPAPGHADDGEDDDGFAESILGAELPDAMRPAPPRERPSRHWSVAALLLAAATLAAFALWNDDRGPLTSGGADLAALDQVLKPFGEVELVATANGFNVRGYVESAARRQQLQQAVAPFGARVNLQVHAADQIVEQARRYLADPNLSLSYAGQGRLVVSGTVDDAAVRRKLKRLAEDLQPAVRVSDQVQVRERPAAEREPAAPQSTALADLQAAMPGRIVSITEHGEQGRYIQLSNGARYYEGAVLPSGAELTRIGTDGLVISGALKADPMHGRSSRKAAAP